MNNTPLTNLSYIKQLAKKYSFSFQKGFGQNFLVNPAICPKIAEVANIDETYAVIEIGTGIGVLSRELCLRAKKVIAIEIDSNLLPVLEETMQGFDNFTVINQDVLKTDLKEIINTHCKGLKVAVCANLPYYITSPIIMKLLEEKLNIESITVMVQKEAALRICSPFKSKEVGAITYSVNYYSSPNICFNVSPGSFHPAPKVTSSVIKLNVLKEPPVKAKDEEKLFFLIRHAFNQRRKTFVNSISTATGISKEALQSTLENLKINPLIRPEQLSLEDFCNISNALF